eukprot:1899201-Amphidinium_carterae.2
MGLADTVVFRTFAGVELHSVGYYTDTGESVWQPIPRLKQSVYRAEFLATVRALEECKPQRLVSDCKGVVSCLHALIAGRRQHRGRHRDLESRAFAALPAGVQIVWMKAHQSDKDADEGRVVRVDLQGKRMADVAANQSTSEHVPLEPFE